MANLGIDGKPLTKHPRLGANRVKDLLGGRGFTKDGWNYTTKFVIFHLAPTTSADKAKGHVEDLCRKFAGKLISEGWEILGPPLVLKPDVVNEALERPTKYSGPAGGLWHPRQLWLENTIPSAHPWVRHGEDLYVGRMPVKRPVKTVDVEIPDMALRFLQATNDPLLETLKFDDWKSSGSSQSIS